MAATATADDCQLSFGEFIADSTGVVARLFGPLAPYSRHIAWPAVSIGFATLRSLMEDLKESSGDTFDLICRKFNLAPSIPDVVERQLGRIEFYIGPDAPARTLWHESDLIEDAMELIGWGTKIAGRCPDVVVAHQLQTLAQMSREELGRYVQRALG